MAWTRARPDDKIRDVIEVLLGTAVRTGEALALRPRDIRDAATGVVAYVNATVVQRQGTGIVSQDRPEIDASQDVCAELRTGGVRRCR